MSGAAEGELGPQEHRTDSPKMPHLPEAQAAHGTAALVTGGVYFVYFSSWDPASKSLGYSGSPEPDTVNALKYVGLVKTVGLEPFWFAIKTRFC